MSRGQVELRKSFCRHFPTTTHQFRLEPSIPGLMLFDFPSTKITFGGCPGIGAVQILSVTQCRCGETTILIFSLL